MNSPMNALETELYPTQQPPSAFHVSLQRYKNTQKYRRLVSGNLEENILNIHFYQHCFVLLNINSSVYLYSLLKTRYPC